MTRAIYLVKCEGYSYEYPNGNKNVYKTTINYHCCTTLEEAQNDVRRWQKEERLENKVKAKENKMQIWHNYCIDILDLYGK